MKRRSLIKGTLASAGLACSYAGLAATGNRQRRNIASFSADEVKIFREAVLDMQSKSAADPESWNYLAAVHRYWPYSSNAEAQKYQHPDVLKTIDFDALAKVPAEERTKYWRACIHHDHPATSHFLSWHRLYLWHFETALLAATDIAAARLGLPRSISGVPYWDYYASPRLPDAFRCMYRIETRQSMLARKALSLPTWMRFAWATCSISQSSSTVKPGEALVVLWKGLFTIMCTVKSAA
jgi:hypothetical protein